MKKLFVVYVLIVLSMSTVFGKKEIPKLPIDSQTNKISYTEVVYVDSLTKKQELFSRAREWFAKTFNSSTNVIQMEDKESGKIIGKALIQVYHKGLVMTYKWGYINYTISVYIKDGRYKYELTDFYHSGQSNTGMGMISAPDYGACEDMINYKSTFGDPIAKNNILSSMISQLNSNSIILVQNLKSAMTTKKMNTTNENW